MATPTAKSDRLAGKLAVVTGAGAGIGQGCALMFARQGARVIGCDIDPAGAQATRERARAEGLDLEVVAPCDLTDEATVQKLMDDIGAQHGAIDVLLNAAAFAVFKWIEEMSYAEWRHTLTGELDIVFLACKYSWPWMKASGAASIVNFASANAYVALNGSPALAHCAGKGGVLAMTRQLAMEGAPHGIRANTISPALTVTAATTPVLQQPAFVDNVMQKAMIKRFGQPEDVAWCATYLASDEASIITGADFAVDAGATAW